MGFFDSLFVPGAVKAASDQKRVKAIFHSGKFQFDDDIGSRLSESSMAYYVGATGQEFNIETLAEYIMRYAAPRGFTLADVANQYADYAKEVATRSGEYYGERNLYVNAWLNPNSRGLDKNWVKDENHALFLDFSAHFLLDVLKLRMNFK